MIRQRLDEALVARQVYPSRARARDAILRGTILVDGEPARKPSQMVLQVTVLTTADEAQKYVSRSALKLIHALDHFEINPDGRVCLDIGASTGGFTQVLLQRGAEHVFAIDVGHGQFDLSLQGNPRVTSIEGLNARDLTADHLKHKIEIIVCDVSFISLKLALPAALDLADSGTHLIALIKPQFEAGRDAVGRGGIVSDPLEHDRVCKEISEFVAAEHWQLIGITPSSIEGGDGNKEFLIAARKN